MFASKTHPAQKYLRIESLGLKLTVLDLGLAMDIHPPHPPTPQESWDGKPWNTSHGSEQDPLPHAGVSLSLTDRNFKSGV